MPNRRITAGQRNRLYRNLGRWAQTTDVLISSNHSQHPASSTQLPPSPIASEIIDHRSFSHELAEEARALPPTDNSIPSSTDLSSFTSPPSLIRSPHDSRGSASPAIARSVASVIQFTRLPDFKDPSTPPPCWGSRSGSPPTDAPLMFPAQQDEWQRTLDRLQMLLRGPAPPEGLVARNDLGCDETEVFIKQPA